MDDFDIVSKLHDLMRSKSGCGDLRISMTAKLAADEIKRLRTEVDTLKRMMPAHITRILYEGQG
jgi:hypothetical protein